MKPHILTLALAVLLVVPATAKPVTRSVPPESFLDYHVDTVPQLASEVASDPAVRARLARHFHCSGPVLCDYVRRRLILKHLTAPLRTRDYCTPRSGHEYYVILTLPTGTPVFAFRQTGKPILRLVCGNPLVAALPPVQKPAAASAHRAKTRTASKRAALPRSRRTTPLAPATISQSTVTPGVSGAGAVGAASGPSEMLFTDAGGASSAAWLTEAALAGGFFVLWSPSGSASSEAPKMALTGNGDRFQGALLPLSSAPSLSPSSFSPLTPQTAPQPVPEPSPALALLIGGLTLGVCGLCRSQRQRRLG